MAKSKKKKKRVEIHGTVLDHPVLHPFVLVNVIHERYGMALKSQ